VACIAVSAANIRTDHAMDADQTIIIMTIRPALSMTVPLKKV